MLSIEKKQQHRSRNESHRKSFKKTITECNHYFNIPKNAF